jgi:hypothetical protein
MFLYSAGDWLCKGYRNKMWHCEFDAIRYDNIGRCSSHQQMHKHHNPQMNSFTLCKRRLSNQQDVRTTYLAPHVYERRMQIDKGNQRSVAAGTYSLREAHVQGQSSIKLTAAAACCDVVWGGLQLDFLWMKPAPLQPQKQLAFAKETAAKSRQNLRLCYFTLTSTYIRQKSALSPTNNIFI